MGHLLSSTILIYLLLLFSLLSISSLSRAQIQSRDLSYRRSLASIDKEGNPTSQKSPPKKKITSQTKNQTELLKPIKPKKTNSTTTTTTTKPKKTNSTTTAKPSLSKFTLNKTLTSTSKTSKLSNSTKLLKTTKLNSTSSSKTKLKPLKKSTDLPLPEAKTQPKPQQPPAIKPTAVVKKKPASESESESEPRPEPIIPWLDSEETNDDDLIAEFRDLPSKFHQALLPDLEKISTTSKAYLYKANMEISKGVQPLVGNKYAPTVANVASAAFLILPLILVIALFHQLRTYLFLQKILLFVQMYLAIYFGILSLTAVVTGLEPLRFFYVSSPGSYVYTQVLQTLGYVLFLLVQLLNLLVVFSTADGGLGSKFLGLAQILVGLAVGLHYYAAVFHRAVLREPPKTNWKIHGVYATCFLVICAFARAERGKKAYLQDGSEDGKKN